MDGGVLSRFHDLIEALKNKRGQLITGFDYLKGLIPQNPDALVQPVLSGIASVLQTIPADPVALLNPYATKLDDLGKLFPTGELPAIKNFKEKLAQALTNLQKIKTLLDSAASRALPLLSQQEVFTTTIARFEQRIAALVDAAKGEALRRQIDKTAELMQLASEKLEKVKLSNARSFQATESALLEAQWSFMEAQTRLDESATEFQRGLAAVETQTLHEQRQSLAENLAAQQANWEEKCEEILQLLQELHAVVENLSLEELRTAITAPLESLRGGIEKTDAALQKVKDGIGKVIAALGRNLKTLDKATTALENNFMAELLDKYTAFIENGGGALVAFKTQIDAALEQVGNFFTDAKDAFKSGSDQAVSTLRSFQTQLEKINLREAAKPAFDAVRNLKTQLASISVSALPAPEAAAFRLGANVLRGINLGPIRNKLLAGYDQIDPSPFVANIAGNLQVFFNRVNEFDPSVLLAPLVDPYSQMIRAAREFDPVSLVGKVLAPMKSLHDVLPQLALDKWMAPVIPPFDDLQTKMAKMAPSTLLTTAMATYNDVVTIFDAIYPVIMGSGKTGGGQALTFERQMMSPFATRGEGMNTAASLTTVQKQFAAIDPAQNKLLLAGLRRSHSRLVSAFAKVDHAGLSDKAREKYNRLADLVQSLAPNAVVAAVQPKMNALKAEVDQFAASFSFRPSDVRLRTFDLGLRTLFQENDLATFRAADSCTDSVKTELQYLKTQIAGLSLQTLTTELESEVYNPISAALRNAGPAVILNDQNLNEIWSEVVATFDHALSGVSALHKEMQTSWETTVKNLNQFDPEEMKKIWLTQFKNIQDAAKSFELARAVDTMKRMLDRVKGDLDGILRDAESTLKALLAALPN